MKTFIRAFAVTFAIVAAVAVVLLRTTEQIEARDASETVAEQEGQVLEDIALQKQVMERQTQLGDRFIESVNNDVELVLYTEDGSFYVNHSRNDTSNTMFDQMRKSDLRIKVSYQATFCIATEALSMENLGGVVYVNYGIDDIYLKSFEQTEVVPVEQLGVFGKKHTKDELVALVQTGTDRTKQTMEGDVGLKHLASDNLDSYLAGIAEDLGIVVVINGVEP